MDILVLPLVIVEPPSDVVLFPRLMDELPIWILVLSRLMEVLPRLRAVRPSVMLVFPMERQAVRRPQASLEDQHQFLFFQFFLSFTVFFGKGSWGSSRAVELQRISRLIACPSGSSTPAQCAFFGCDKERENEEDKIRERERESRGKRLH